jgi:CheY-like chemotaxis protein
VTQILVIEDDRDIRDLLRDVLSDEGYELLFVEHPDRAPADAAPDLVITDLVGLQHYDGGAARASIRRLQERYPAAPVIVCTAQEEAIDEPDRLGAAALLSKPFTIELLLETVARPICQPTTTTRP